MVDFTGETDGQTEKDWDRQTDRQTDRDREKQWINQTSVYRNDKSANPQLSVVEDPFELLVCRSIDKWSLSCFSQCVNSLHPLRLIWARRWFSVLKTWLGKPNQLPNKRRKEKVGIVIFIRVYQKYF